MEQLQNGLLTMLQTTLQQVPGVGGKNESGSGDEFQKLLERAQNPQDVEQPEPAKKPQTPDKKEPAKAETTREKPAEQTNPPAKNQQVQDAAQQERMLLAAMQALQTPVAVEEVPAASQGEELLFTPVDLAVDENAAVVLLDGEELKPMTMAEANAFLGETQVQPETEAAAEEPVLTQTVPQAEVQPQEEAPVEDMVESVRVETGAPEENTEDSTQDKDLSAEAQPLFRNVEAAPIKVGDAHAAETTRQPDQVGDQVMGALNQAMAQGETKVELQLTPENLGKVSIELHFDKLGNLESILIGAERRGTMDLLNKNLPDMMRAFGQRYGEEVRVEIQQPQESQQEQQRQYDGHNGHNGQPQDEERQHRRQSRSENPEDFLHQLRLGLIDADEA